jgi:hypothetical protein
MKLKSGFYPLKKKVIVSYSKYFLVQGVWVYNDPGMKPVKCWGTYTPDKTFLGCSMGFLDAKERVKTDKISKFISRK